MRRILMLAAAAVAATASGAAASTEGAYISGNGGVSLTPNLTLKNDTLGNLTELQPTRTLRPVRRVAGQSAVQG